MSDNTTKVRRMTDEVKVELGPAARRLTPYNSSGARGMVPGQSIHTGSIDRERVPTRAFRFDYNSSHAQTQQQPSRPAIPAAHPPAPPSPPAPAKDTRPAAVSEVKTPLSPILTPQSAMRSPTLQPPPAMRFDVRVDAHVPGEGTIRDIRVDQASLDSFLGSPEGQSLLPSRKNSPGPPPPLQEASQARRQMPLDRPLPPPAVVTGAPPAAGTQNADSFRPEDRKRAGVPQQRASSAHAPPAAAGASRRSASTDKQQQQQQQQSRGETSDREADRAGVRKRTPLPKERKPPVGLKPTLPDQQQQQQQSHTGRAAMRGARPPAGPSTAARVGKAAAVEPTAPPAAPLEESKEARLLDQGPPQRVPITRAADAIRSMGGDFDALERMRNASSSGSGARKPGPVAKSREPSREPPKDKTAQELPKEAPAAAAHETRPPAVPRPGARLHSAAPLAPRGFKEARRPSPRPPAPRSSSARRAGGPVGLDTSAEMRTKEEPAIGRAGVGVAVKSGGASPANAYRQIAQAFRPSTTPKPSPPRPTRASAHVSPKEPPKVVAERPKTDRRPSSARQPSARDENKQLQAAVLKELANAFTRPAAVSPPPAARGAGAAAAAAASDVNVGVGVGDLDTDRPVSTVADIGAPAADEGKQADRHVPMELTEMAQGLLRETETRKKQEDDSRRQRIAMTKKTRQHQAAGEAPVAAVGRPASAAPARPSSATVRPAQRPPTHKAGRPMAAHRPPSVPAASRDLTSRREPSTSRSPPLASPVIPGMAVAVAVGRPAETEKAPPVDDQVKKAQERVRIRKMAEAARQQREREEGQHRRDNVRRLDAYYRNPPPPPKPKSDRGTSLPPPAEGEGVDVAPATRPTQRTRPPVATKTVRAASGPAQRGTTADRSQSVPPKEAAEELTERPKAGPFGDLRSDIAQFEMDIVATAPRGFRSRPLTPPPPPPAARREARQKPAVAGPTKQLQKKPRSVEPHREQPPDRKVPQPFKPPRMDLTVPKSHREAAGMLQSLTNRTDEMMDQYHNWYGVVSGSEVGGAEQQGPATAGKTEADGREREVEGVRPMEDRIAEQARRTPPREERDAEPWQVSTVESFSDLGGLRFLSEGAAGERPPGQPSLQEAGQRARQRDEKAATDIQRVWRGSKSRETTQSLLDHQLAAPLTRSQPSRLPPPLHGPPPPHSHGTSLPAIHLPIDTSVSHTVSRSIDDQDELDFEEEEVAHRQTEDAIDHRSKAAPLAAKMATPVPRIPGWGEGGLRRVASDRRRTNDTSTRIGEDDSTRGMVQESLRDMEEMSRLWGPQMLRGTPPFDRPDLGLGGARDRARPLGGAASIESFQETPAAVIPPVVPRTGGPYDVPVVEALLHDPARQRPTAPPAAAAAVDRTVDRETAPLVAASSVPPAASTTSIEATEGTSGALSPISQHRRTSRGDDLSEEARHALSVARPESALGLRDGWDDHPRFNAAAAVSGEVSAYTGRSDGAVASSEGDESAWRREGDGEMEHGLEVDGGGRVEVGVQKGGSPLEESMEAGEALSQSPEEMTAQFNNAMAQLETVQEATQRADDLGRLQQHMAALTEAAIHAQHQEARQQARYEEDLLRAQEMAAQPPQTAPAAAADRERADRDRRVERDTRREGDTAIPPSLPLPHHPFSRHQDYSSLSSSPRFSDTSDRGSFPHDPMYFRPSSPSPRHHRRRRGDVSRPSSGHSSPSGMSLGGDDVDSSALIQKYRQKVYFEEQYLDEQLNYHRQRHERKMRRLHDKVAEVKAQQMRESGASTDDYLDAELERLQLYEDRCLQDYESHCLRIRMRKTTRKEHLMAMERRHKRRERPRHPESPPLSGRSRQEGGAEGGGEALTAKRLRLEHELEEVKRQQQQVAHEAAPPEPIISSTAAAAAQAAGRTPSFAEPSEGPYSMRFEEESPSQAPDRQEDRGDEISEDIQIDEASSDDRHADEWRRMQEEEAILTRGDDKEEEGQEGEAPAAASAAASGQPQHVVERPLPVAPHLVLPKKPSEDYSSSFASEGEGRGVERQESEIPESIPEELPSGEDADDEAEGPSSDALPAGDVTDEGPPRHGDITLPQPEPTAPEPPANTAALHEREMEEMEEFEPDEASPVARGVPRRAPAELEADTAEARAGEQVVRPEDVNVEEPPAAEQEDQRESEMPARAEQAAPEAEAPSVVQREAPPPEEIEEDIHVEAEEGEGEDRPGQEEHHADTVVDSEAPTLPTARPDEVDTPERRVEYALSIGRPGTPAPDHDVNLRDRDEWMEDWERENREEGGGLGAELMGLDTPRPAIPRPAVQVQEDERLTRQNEALDMFYPQIRDANLEDGPDWVDDMALVAYDLIDREINRCVVAAVREAHLNHQGTWHRLPIQCTANMAAGVFDFVLETFGISEIAPLTADFSHRYVMSQSPSAPPLPACLRINWKGLVNHLVSSRRRLQEIGERKSRQGPGAGQSELSPAWCGRLSPEWDDIARKQLNAPAYEKRGRGGRRLLHDYDEYGDEEDEGVESSAMVRAAAEANVNPTKSEQVLPVLAVDKPFINLVLSLTEALINQYRREITNHPTRPFNKKWNHIKEELISCIKPGDDQHRIEAAAMGQDEAGRYEASMMGRTTEPPLEMRPFREDQTSDYKDVWYEYRDIEATALKDFVANEIWDDLVNELCWEMWDMEEPHPQAAVGGRRSGGGQPAGGAQPPSEPSEPSAAAAAAPAPADPAVSIGTRSGGGGLGRRPRSFAELEEAAKGMSAREFLESMGMS
ncbi:unnamed protein product [Vitrella brassicaformis CCMP3155]|uniref:Uncharacterized protein n=3 Tax=Vitrella brassicaformis TaxID=1169539 RepID=A0A0G4G8T9_VITBC|nr:unnamed protein product [Vitrella brassicaformis CCMP3155]|eukprot:CEM25266.1 unnamed protein product [Vitrella brassicaformis CCMP3155]